MLAITRQLTYWACSLFAVGVLRFFEHAAFMGRAWLCIFMACVIAFDLITMSSDSYLQVRKKILYRRVVYYVFTGLCLLAVGFVTNLCHDTWYAAAHRDEGDAETRKLIIHACMAYITLAEFEYRRSQVRNTTL